MSMYGNYPNPYLTNKYKTMSKETVYTEGFILESTRFKDGAEGIIGDDGEFTHTTKGEYIHIFKNEAEVHKALLKFLITRKGTHCVEFKKVTYIENN